MLRAYQTAEATLLPTHKHFTPCVMFSGDMKCFDDMSHSCSCTARQLIFADNNTACLQTCTVFQATKVLLWPAGKNTCYAHHMHSASQQLFAALLRRFEPAPAHARLRKSRPAQRTRSERVGALLQSVRTDHGALAPLISTIFVARALAADGDAWPQATSKQLQWSTAIQRDQNGHDLLRLPRRRIPMHADHCTSSQIPSGANFLSLEVATCSW